MGGSTVGVTQELFAYECFLWVRRGATGKWEGSNIAPYPGKRSRRPFLFFFPMIWHYPISGMGTKNSMYNVFLRMCEKMLEKLQESY
jgi:hypothetical protein